MYISLQELELRKVDFQEAFQPGVIDLGPEVRQLDPLTAGGRAEVVEEHHGKREVVTDIRLVGNLDTRLETSCARCLEPVKFDIERDFDVLYRPLGADRKADEVSITEAETEIGYYQGDGILLEDVLREQVLLAVPLRLLCNEACKGLCPQCGTNLNTESCNCERGMKDPRWAALNEIREKLK